MEILKTRRDLAWTKEEEFNTTSFHIENREYGITAVEESIDGFSTLRVDFHSIKSGEMNHSVTKLNTDQFKVIGIVSNAILEKFPKKEIIFFCAKRRLCVDEDGQPDEIQYTNRVSTYSRITQRLSTENNMFAVKISLSDETIFGLCKTREAEKAFRNSI